MAGQTTEGGRVLVDPVVPVDSRTRRTRRHRPAARSGWWPAAFIGPVMLGVVVFYLWPIVQTAYFGFTKWGVFGGATWTGLANYRRMFKDPEVGRAFVNTLVFTAIVLLRVPIAVVLADLVNLPKLRFAAFYRALYFLPYVTMPVAIATAWRMIYNGDFGILNWTLGLVGIDGPRWLTTEWVALVAVALVGIWMGVGFDLIILSAARRSIPAQVYEAATLDGASTWRQFRSITVPLLTPSIFFLTVITIIGGFQLFDLLYAIIGPANPVMSRTQSMVYLFYAKSFPGNDKGYGAAIAMLILVVVGIITLIQFRWQRRWVHHG